MATRGVFQLTTLRLYYCEHGGSSNTVREYIRKGRLVAWATGALNVQIRVAVRNGHHPYIQANYQESDTIQHQVSVKNVESFQEIDTLLNLLRNRSGRKIKKLVNPVVTDTPSVQGVWTPFLNLQLEPSFSIRIDENHSTSSAP